MRCRRASWHFAETRRRNVQVSIWTIEKEMKGGKKKKRLCLRWEVVDTSGGVEGSSQDGWVWDKIVCEDIVEATTDFSGSERIVGKVFLGKGKKK